MEPGFKGNAVKAEKAPNADAEIEKVGIDRRVVVFEKQSVAEITEVMRVGEIQIRMGVKNVKVIGCAKTETF